MSRGGIGRSLHLTSLLRGKIWQNAQANQGLLRNEILKTGSLRGRIDEAKNYGFFLRAYSTESSSHIDPQLSEYNQKLKAAVTFFSAKDRPKVLERTLAVCIEMKEKGIKPNLQSYNYLFEALISKNQLSFAITLLDEMLKSGINPDIVTTNFLIKLHVPFGDFLGAMAIFELQDKLGIQPTSETFHSLVEAAANSPPHSSKVGAIVKEMLKRKLYTQEAAARAIESLTYTLHTHEAFEIIKLIEKEKEKVPLTGYADALYGLAQTDNNEGVNHCFKALRTGKLTDITLDEGLLLQVLTHAKKTADADLAHEAIFALEEVKPLFMDFHFLPLLDILAEKGSYFRMFELILLMKSMKIELSLKSFNEAIFKISTKPENMDKAFFALEDLKSQKTLDIFIFNIVLAACAVGKDLDRTFATFAEAANLGVTPNLDTYHTLLDVCFRTRQRRVAERVWKEIEKSGLEINAETYSKYIDTLLFSGGFDLAKQLFQEVNEKKIALPEGTYVRLLLTFTPTDKPFANYVANAMKFVGNYRVGARLLQGLEERPAGAFDDS